MNYKIGFMSLLVITSIIFLFLVPGSTFYKVEAQKECIAPCTLVGDCTAACISKGYTVGQCVGWKDKDPFICCCN
ncbi:hypothetical protein ISN45_Aa03g007480 [Arabidopsis thaliana x Arabidopsis arenosa]|uniref:Uncharacterized protein n=2 Tax=Arabidopsis TaxID=3701 RepID=A0A8T2B8B6_ARASU|nr:hypothetical protein ISN45_Aa03g007480 [Arabidopsis thaliana x Arabidopsis arenosa]KAG7581434.1 hypothetical protein ISN44_As08g011210 [Arabidopsis suecica]